MCIYQNNWNNQDQQTKCKGDCYVNSFDTTITTRYINVQRPINAHCDTDDP